MRRLRFCLIAVATLTGCQGTPIGDAMIGEGRLAQMDDQYCQSIGAKAGTDNYTQCRMFKTSQREQGHQQAFRRAGAGFAAAGSGLQQGAYTNRPVNCTVTPQSTFVGGAPSSYNTSCR